MFFMYFQGVTGIYKSIAMVYRVNESLVVKELEE